MSWSVGATGSVDEVKEELGRQFGYPLAETGGLEDAGERKTVNLVRDVIFQALGTFEPSKRVQVLANGHTAFENWTTKAGAVQTVNFSIQPMA